MGPKSRYTRAFQQLPVSKEPKLIMSVLTMVILKNEATANIEKVSRCLNRATQFTKVPGRYIGVDFYNIPAAEVQTYIVFGIHMHASMGSMYGTIVVVYGPQDMHAYLLIYT